MQLRVCVLVSLAWSATVTGSLVGKTQLLDFSTTSNHSVLTQENKREHGEMTESASATVYLRDYKPPQFKVKHVDLTIRLHETATHVSATLQVYRNPKSILPTSNVDLKLDGEFFELKSIEINNQQVQVVYNPEDKKGLVIEQVQLPAGPEPFLVKVETKIDPSRNTDLEGLYLDKASGSLVTQMEAQGMRRLIPFIDRPDHQATYRVRLEGDKLKYPVLLSNGAQIESGDLPSNHHYSIWEDNVAKPCYLLCLIGGSYEALRSEVKLRDGRSVPVVFWGEKQDLPRLKLGMETTIKTILWDERRFNRLYPYATAQAIAFSTYTHGAMENAALVTYNTANVMFDPAPKTGFSTDSQGLAVISTTCHELCHSHSGNLTTIQSPFYLSLKEGLTTAREQLFSYENVGEAITRLKVLQNLRSLQFPEDAGPLSRPVIIDSYASQTALYSHTTYKKGAELFVVLRNLLGEETFAKGLENYFDTTQGRESTLPEFMELVGKTAKRDLTQFSKWFYQRGTPEVQVESQVFDAEKKTFRLDLKQIISPRALSHGEKDFLMIPVLTALIGKDTKRFIADERVLELDQEQKSFFFENVEEMPVVSLLRRFSAPVIVRPFQSDEELSFIAKYDTDAFTRLEAATQLYTNDIIKSMDEFTISEGSLSVFGAVLESLVNADLSSDRECAAIAASLLSLPSITEMVQKLKPQADPPKLSSLREDYKYNLAKAHEDKLRKVYNEIESICSKFHYELEAGQIGARSLKNVLLGYLTLIDLKEGRDSVAIERLKKIYHNSTNYTESYFAYNVIAYHFLDTAAYEEIRDHFMGTCKEEMRYYGYLSALAESKSTKTLEFVKKEAEQKRFDGTNPNMLRQLCLAYSARNPSFYTAEGIQFLVSEIRRLAKSNAYMAYHFTRRLTDYKDYAKPISSLMESALVELMADRENLPTVVVEVLEKTLHENE